MTIPSDPDWYAGDSAAKAAGLTELIEGAGLRPASLLDVGCGAGGVLAALCTSLGASGVGIDPRPEAIALAQSHPGLELHVGEVSDTELQADLVLCVDVFEHVDDDLGFLRELRSHGEHFAFRIPLDESVWDRLRGRTEAFRHEYGHLHAYTRRRALRLLRDAGYAVVAERYHRIPAGGPVGRGVRQVLGSVAPHSAARVVGGWSLLVLARPA